ncbi:hypothetical protein ACS60E_10760, partial [Streptococcus suis]
KGSIISTVDLPTTDIIEPFLLDNTYQKQSIYKKNESIVNYLNLRTIPNNSLLKQNAIFAIEYQ